MFYSYGSFNSKPIQPPTTPPLCLSASLSRFVDDLSYFGGLAEIAWIQFISLINWLIMETTIVHK